MGIQGLLPLLKDIQRKVTLQSFKGQTVGIDAYCWLHKGAYGCAFDLAEGKDSSVYLNYILRRITMLQNFAITPILVFDGGYLPAKALKEAERRKGREENLKKGKALLRAGNKSQAVDCFQKCINITPAMATKVIKACRQKNILCIVAPYEADAQLAYLQKQGITDLTITEDSDLLIYGCTKVLFKMTADGEGILIDLAELNKVRSMSFSSFTYEKFRHMCMLSGCDYLPSIRGMGLVKSYKIISKSSDVYRAIKAIKLENSMKVPHNYEDNFRKADAVFKFQSVFDYRLQKIVPLNEITPDADVTEEDLEYAGPTLTSEKACAIALGNLDPITGEELAQLQNFHITDKEKTPQMDSTSISNNSSQSSSAFLMTKKKKNNVIHYCIDPPKDIGMNESTDCLIEGLYKSRESDSSKNRRVEDGDKNHQVIPIAPGITPTRSILNPFKKTESKKKKEEDEICTSKYFIFGAREEGKPKSEKTKQKGVLDMLQQEQKVKEKKERDNEDDLNEFDITNKDDKPLSPFDLNSPSSPIRSFDGHSSDGCTLSPSIVDDDREKGSTNGHLEKSSNNESFSDPCDVSVSISRKTNELHNKENVTGHGKRIGLFNQRNSTQGKTYIVDLIQRFSRTTETSRCGDDLSSCSVSERDDRPFSPFFKKETSLTRSKQQSTETKWKEESTESEEKNKETKIWPRMDLIAPVVNKSTPGRCKSLGLSRKRKSVEPIDASNKKLQQTQLTLQKYSFQKKSISW